MIIRPLVAVAVVAVSLFLFAGPADVTTAPVVASSSAADRYVVDAGHSTVLFRVLHANAGAFWGRFNKVKGDFVLDPSDYDGSYVNVTVDATSVDSNSEGRDRHLRNADFLSAKEFPEITFKSSKVEDGGDGNFKVTGALFFRGVTKTITLTAVHTGSSNSERFGPRVGYEAIFTFKRSEFGSKYGIEGNAVGDEVRMVVAVEGAKPRPGGRRR